jgi:16S rRNA processing protein RimM
VNDDILAIGRLGAPKGVRGDLKVHSYSGEVAHFLKLKEVTLRGGDSGAAPGRLLKLKVSRIGGADGPVAGLTMAFEGYPSPETARVLTGMDIVVPRSEAAALGPNEWYVDDLVGLSLVVGGEKVATVRAVIEGGPDPWLEAVRLPSDADLGGQSSSGAGRAAKRYPEGSDPSSSGAGRAAKQNPEGANPGGSVGTAKRNPEGVSLVPFRKEFVGEVDLEAGTIELLAPELLEP